MTGCGDVRHGGGATPAAGAHRSFEVADRSFAPAWTYFSPELFDREMREVFPGTWVFVGDAHALREPGDHLTELIGHEPVVVLRDEDGELRAFSNVCPHRASLVASGTGNCGTKLTCPYHGWTFSLDGRLLGTPLRGQFERSPVTSDHSLKPVRFELWDRWIFVNVSGDAPPLMEHLGEIPELMANHRMSEMTLGDSLDDLVDVNWKIMMDNAFCDYHVGEVHANSIGRFATLRGGIERATTTAGVLELPWNAARLHDVRPELVGPGAAGSIGCAAFPNFHLIGFPTGGITVMWWTPVGPFETRARVLSYSLDVASDPRASRELLEVTQLEDYDICRKVQIGLRSGTYVPGPQHYFERRVAAFQRWLADALHAT